MNWSAAYPSSPCDLEAGEVASSVGEGAWSWFAILRLYGGGNDNGLDPVHVSFDHGN
jgi:hypothetical protein